MARERGAVRDLHLASFSMHFLSAKPLALVEDGRQEAPPAISLHLLRSSPWVALRMIDSHNDSARARRLTLPELPEV